ncbi:carboxypeptidase B [Caerostris darwini]|uniref:Carboxypeptidase B n=1 Tax=Caerostris darwini TaxID=1538125 RepID=A0AAV4X5Q2_9ARAC|nr:carboxypeptidase B [Caerostris darwini]
MNLIWNYISFLIHCINFLVVAVSEKNNTFNSNHEGQKLFKVYMNSEKDVQALKRIEEKCQDCIIQWTDYFAQNTKVILHVKEDSVNEVRDDLLKHNLTHEMLKDSYLDVVKKERNPLRSPQHDEFGYNYAKHNGFGAIRSLLIGLTNKYKRISRLEIVECTIEIRPIYAVHISNDWSNTKPIIMIECGIHAREWASVEACIYFISVLLKQKTENIKRIMDQYDFVILPLLNPDGYVYSMSKSRFWRKNRHCDKQYEMCDLNCVGIDLNRNFDINFCEDQSPQCAATYCGSKPFSEKETQAVRNILKRLQKRLFAFFDIHSYGAMWMFPYAKSMEIPRNYEEMKRLSEIAVEAIKKVNGSEYRVGPAARVVYTASGSSMDYAFDVINVKYAFAIELREANINPLGFIMHEEEIQPLLEETWTGLEACILAMNPYK